MLVWQTWGIPLGKLTQMGQPMGKPVRKMIPYDQHEMNVGVAYSETKPVAVLPRHQWSTQVPFGTKNRSCGVTTWQSYWGIHLGLLGYKDMEQYTPIGHLILFPTLALHRPYTPKKRHGTWKTIIYINEHRRASLGLSEGCPRHDKLRYPTYIRRSNIIHKYILLVIYIYTLHIYISQYLPVVEVLYNPMFFALVSIEIYYDKRFGFWDTLLQPKPLN